MSGAGKLESEVLGSIMHFVTDENWTTILLDHLLKQEYLGVDCEGVNLGYLGKVTQVQVATPAGFVFLFDMLQKGVHNGVRTLLQSNVIKVMHDCQANVANLFAEHKIFCQQVVDTKLAQIYIDSKNGNNSPRSKLGLNDLNIMYGLPPNPFKGKIDYSKNQRYWEQRPLTEDMMCYAASDVLSLVKLYPLLRAKIAQPLEFLEICASKIRDIVFNSGSPQTPTMCSTHSVKEEIRSPDSKPFSILCVEKSKFEKTVVVAGKKKAAKVTERLLKQKFIAVDIKWIEDDSGTVTPCMLNAGTEAREYFIFDLTSDVIIDFVRTFMECTNLVKVVHDCRDAVSSLYRPYAIQIKRVFDTQMAHRAIKSPNGLERNCIGLNKLCEVYNIPSNPYLDVFTQPNWVHVRPLTVPMMCRAAYDVEILLTLFSFLSNKITNLESVMLRSSNRVLQEQKELNEKNNSANE